MPRPSEPPERDKTFPVRHVAAIEPRPKDALWLVESLWAASGVGIVGGLPKSLKTWLSTELAVAVASGKDALGRFPVKLPGPVLVYAAEDDLPSMRARFQAVADARGVALKDIPVYLIDLPTLRLDDRDQLRRLHSTVARLRPRLLVLDPFIRVVRLDENSAQEVSAVLGSLRALQRELDVAVLLVHHMRKSPSAHLGQQLRGSSDFAAWSDSGMYLVRDGPGDLVLSVEHRGAPAPPPLRLRLASSGPPHLVIDATAASPVVLGGEASPLPEAILERLRSSRRPLATVELRDMLKVRKASLLDALNGLRSRSLVRRVQQGWVLATAPVQLVLDE
ncbi:MAG: AAA family ATPase [Myxococcaceae bacterium]